MMQLYLDIPATYSEALQDLGAAVTAATAAAAAAAGGCRCYLRANMSLTL